MSVNRLTAMPAGLPSSPRKEETNKTIVDRWLTSFWGKDYDSAIVDELAAPGIFFSYSLHTPRVEPASLRAFLADLREAFPDLSLERTADLVADGDVVMFRWMCEGTHTGPAFYDLPMGSLPDTSDREMRFSGMTAIRLKEEKIIEEIGLADGVTALNQLRFIRVPVWPS
jgi:predicted ester cyclase